jgi:hypothetical protein
MMLSYLRCENGYKILGLMKLIDFTLIAAPVSAKHDYLLSYDVKIFKRVLLFITYIKLLVAFENR